MYIPCVLLNYTNHNHTQLYQINCKRMHSVNICEVNSYESRVNVMLILAFLRLTAFVYLCVRKQSTRMRPSTR